jgi:hypothetical protein
LDATALFSDQKVSELLEGATQEPRSPIERHHLFPKAHLEDLGVKSIAKKNQIANYGLVEWGDNVGIGRKAPKEYLPTYLARFSASTLERMYFWHALPDGWEEMDYDEFLRKRREMIGAVVREAFSRLDDAGPKPDHVKVLNIPQLVQDGENSTTEFKSTLRRNLHTNENDPRMEHSALKTIVGFLNAKAGGTLLIGVSDEGVAMGISSDNFPNEDKMFLHLNNLIKDRIGAENMLYIDAHFDDLDDARVLIVDCLPARSPVYLADKGEERFYIRSVASTLELKGSEAQSYIEQRF